MQFNLRNVNKLQQITSRFLYDGLYCFFQPPQKVPASKNLIIYIVATA